MRVMHSSPTRWYVELDGRKLSYLEWGAASSPTMVLLHGGNSAAADWQDLAEAFAGQFHILGPDTRGRGYSDWDPAQDYTVEATVNDLEAWRAALGLERFALTGHSFGAVCGLVYAARFPEHVSRLVLLDGGPVPDRTPEDRARRGPGLADIPLVKWSRAGDPIMLNQWPFVEALQCPTLVVRGGASPLFGTAIVERMLAMSPHVSAVEIPGAGHSVQHEKPAEVIAEMRQFLQ